MAILTLRIENMHCGSCIRRVTQTLNALPGTHAAEVHVGSARVHTSVPPDAIQRSLSAVGYPSLVEFSSET
jgi:copper chaperone CopZ